MDDVLGYLKLLYRSQIRFVLNDLEVYIYVELSTVFQVRQILLQFGSPAPKRHIA